MSTEGPVSALRVGLVGGGFMATVHTRAIRAAGAHVHGIAASTPLRSTAAAAELGYENAFDDVDALVRDKSIDIVHICTPNALHEQFALAAIEHGKHVICEKPLGIDTDSAARLVAAAHRAGVTATVPFVYRFHPMVREARARIGAGDLGRVVTVTGSYLQDWMLDPAEGNWRVDSTSGGRSRAFGDIGSHLVDALEFVAEQRITEILAVTSIVHPVREGKQVDTEDVAAALVRFDGGAIGAVTVSQTAAGHDNDLTFEIFGTDATVSFTQESPDRLTIRRRGSSEVIGRNPALLHSDAARLCTVPAGHPMGYQDAFNAYVRDTYSAVMGCPVVGTPSFYDGMRANQLTDAVIESARTGAWVQTPIDALTPIDGLMPQLRPTDSNRRKVSA